MLQGYKSFIGIGVWAAGAVLVEFFANTPGLVAFGEPLMQFGKLIFAGGMAAKASRYMKR